MSSTEPQPDESGGSAALDKSRESLAEAKDAARKVFEGDEPADLDAPGTGEGLESDEEDVAPRPN